MLTDADLDRIEAAASDPDRFDVLALVLEVRRLKSLPPPETHAADSEDKTPWMNLEQAQALSRQGSILLFPNATESP